MSRTVGLNRGQEKCRIDTREGSSTGLNDVEVVFKPGVFDNGTDLARVLRRMIHCFEEGRIKLG